MVLSIEGSDLEAYGPYVWCTVSVPYFQSCGPDLSSIDFPQARNVHVTIKVRVYDSNVLVGS